MHSWLETQNEGWVRYAFDQMGVPYTYISDQFLRTPHSLDAFDVVVFPHVSGSMTSLINGRPMVGPPIPWKKTALTPNLDRWDQTDDIRPGMGLDGAAALRSFVERGGLLITTGNSSVLPITLGFNPTVTQATTTQVECARLGDSGAAGAGFFEFTDSVWVRGLELSDLFQPGARVQRRGAGHGGPRATRSGVRAAGGADAGADDSRFHDKADSLLVSGFMVGGDELAGKAAVVDAPLGQGHVVMFGIRPMWRWESQGSFALALNAIANWEHLGF